MGAGRAETDRAEDAGQERDVVVLQRFRAELALVVERRHHVQAEDVGLALLEGRRLFLERLAHRARAVERVLDPEAVGHLVEHRVGEERVEGDVPALVLGDQDLGDGNQDAIELGPHRVLELQPPRPLGQLDLLVVGQVDRDRLRARVAVARVVDDVVGVEVRVGAGRLPLVLVGDGQPALQLGQERRVARQPFAPLQVLDQHEPLERRLGAQQLILVGLDRTDDDVETVVLHVHPGHVAGLIVVGLHRLGTQQQVLFERLLLGHGRRLAQAVGGERDLVLEELAVRDRLQRPVVVAANHRVEARQRLVARGLDLFLRHVRRVEVGAGRLLTHAVEERFVGIQPVPRSVVDQRELPQRGIGDRTEKPALVAVGLLPERVVHRLRGLDQQLEEPAVGGVERRDVGRQRYRRVLAHERGSVDDLAVALRVRGVLRRRAGQRNANTNNDRYET